MREIQMKIYEHSPIPVQNILTTVEGYRKSKSRFGSTYYKALKELENRNYANYESEKRYQEEEIQKLIRHAVAHSPFYQKFYSGIDVHSIRTVEDLKKLPILEKEMVRKHAKDMYTIKEENGIVSLTSGTSGTPLRMLSTKEDLQKRMAFLDHFKKQHGVINLEMKRASFSAHRFIPKNQKSKVFWRDNVAARQRLYSTFFCHRHTAGDFAKNLNTYKPDFIDGLPSGIYEVAKWINENQYRLSYQPIGIFTTGETLYSFYRNEIEKAFGCPVRDQYASSEGAPFIAECPKGKLHYNMNTGVIEVQEDGNMLVTCFNTYGTPLIRYNIGDKARLSSADERCECGSSHPVVKELLGRTNECLVSKDGRRYTAIYMSVVHGKLVNAIKKLQFIQHDLDTIEALLEAGEGQTEGAVAAVRDELEYMFGETMNIIVRVVDHISNEATGKYRIIISHLPAESTAGVPQ